MAPLGVKPTYLMSTYCSGATTFMGVPVKYFNNGKTFKNDEVAAGIYCVKGDIKIQSRVSGSAVLLATGLITTSGGNHNLTTADPTGADLLILAGSTNNKAISLSSTDGVFKGALVAAGGISMSSSGTIVDTGLVARQVTVSGNSNLLKAPQ